MKKIKLAGIFLLSLQISSVLCISQSVLQKEISANEGTVSFMRFDMKNNPVFIQNAKKVLYDKLNLTPDDDFKLLLDTIDNLGIRHQYYLQFYKGIPVEKTVYVIHSKKQIIETINGDFARIRLLAFKNTVDTVSAFQSALAFIHEKVKGSGKVGSAPILKNEPTKAQMVIIKGYLQKPFRYYRTLKFQIGTIKPFTEHYVYVDVETGNVVHYEDLLSHGNAPGSGDSRYSGTVNFTSDSYSGGYRLRQVRNGTDIVTLNFSTSSNPVDFSDNDNNWTSAEHNNAAQDNVALDAHWGAEKVYDYFYTVHGRNSIDNQGMKMEGHVHQQGWEGVGAWYRPERYAFYGDNDANFKPMTALDVVSHEFGHGISQFSRSNPAVAGFGFPGIPKAIEEGFSDLWAICVENYAMPARPIWLVGDQIMVNPNKSCLRNVENPKDPTAFQKLAACVGGVNWLNPNTDPYSADMFYQNLGVLTHWFYILSVGKAGTNDIGNSYDVSGIGIAKAEKIAYRALTVYITPQVDYNGVRTAMISAATDLYGATSCEVVSVTNAWYAVGVGASYNYQYTISGSYMVCTNITTSYTLQETIPLGATVTWSIYPDDGSITLTTSGNSVILDASNVTSDRHYNLTALVQSNCIHGSAFAQFFVPSNRWNGSVAGFQGWSNALYSVPLVEGDNYLYLGSGATWFEAQLGSSYYNGTWSNVWWEYVSGDYTPYTNSGIYRIGYDLSSYTGSNGYVDSYYNFHYTDECGTYSVPFHFMQSNSSPPSYRVQQPKEMYQLNLSPNPAATFVNISVVEIENNKSMGSNLFDYNSQKIIKVYDKLGNLLIQRNELVPKSGLRLNISLLKSSDIYNVIIEDRNGFRLSGKFIKL